MAPVARVGNMKSGLLKLVNFFSPKIVKDMMSEEFMPEVKEGLHKDFGIWINNAFPSMANTMIDLIADKNSMKVNNQNRVPVYLSHYPSGTSLKSIKHFTQNSESKKFEMYNYGKEANCFLYQSINPSEYDLSSLNGFNIALISGGEDKLSNKADVLWLKEILDKGGNLSYFKEYKEMGHISFMVGLNVDWFNDVVDFVYSNSDIELSKLKQKEIYETKLN